MNRMKVSYENDTQRGAGHGIFRCAGLTASADCVFELERGSDHCFLNARDWSSQRSRLAPLAVQQEGDTALLFLGPDIVNQLDMSETYRISVQTADNTVAVAGFRAQNIIYGLAAGGTGGMAAAPEPVQPAARPEPEPEPEPAPETDSPADETPEPQAPAVPAGPESLDLTPQPHKQEKSGHLLPALLALLVILALLGAGLWWFFFKEDPAEKPPFAQAPQQQEQPEAKPETKPEAKPETKPETGPAPAAEPSEPPARKNAEEAGQSRAPASVPSQVTAFFSGSGRTPGAAAALSQKLSTASPAEQDAVYRLLTYAGENGETSQLLPYGACLDPSTPAWGTIQKDALAAWEIYARARAAGQDKAAEAQKKLRAWLEKEAGAGNAQARQWLQALPQE